MPISIKAYGRGLGAILAVGGILLFVIGTEGNHPEAIPLGELLIVLAVVLWFVSLVSRRL